jgi:hypothetical protein
LFYIKQITFSASSGPFDQFDGEPHTMIYDPGKLIHDPVTQLNPFGSMVNVYHEVKDLTSQIRKLNHKKLFLLLIFPDKSEAEVRCFLRKYIPNEAHLHSIFLIFPNGVQYDRQWSNSLAMPKLRWCRSYTNRLIRDVLEMCRSACEENITFFGQRMLLAEDDVIQGSAGNAASMVGLFGGRKIYFCKLLSTYLATSANSGD